MFDLFDQYKSAHCIVEPYQDKNGIFLGDLNSAKSKEFLEGNKIFAVLSVISPGIKLKEISELKLNHMRLDAEDSHDQDLQ